MARPALVLLVLAACATPGGRVAHDTPDAVNIVKARATGAAQAFSWHPWSKATFAKAKAEGKFLLVDGAAEWCHWCHVMDETTYRDPEVGKLLSEKIIAVRVDVDERPDLAERYGDWGWPATILLSPDAEELGKFRGYLPADRLLEILRTLDTAQAEARPEPIPGIPLADLPKAAEHAVARLDYFWDARDGGWGLRRKVPIGLNVVWEFSGGDPKRAAFTLDQQRVLIDRVWGGIYQYSAAEDWNSPHFEKLLTYQAPNLEAFALGFAKTGDRRFLEDAQLLYHYLDTVLSDPGGGFYVNQDADLNAHDRSKPFVDGHVFYALDDAGRRKLGTPWVDTHVYARENGLAISALVRFATDGQSAEALARAIRAATALERSHVLPDGSVKHAADSAGPFFLADAAALGLGFAHLGAATKDPKWSALAAKIAARMKERLGGGPSGALFDHTEDPDAHGVFTVRLASFVHNVTAARLLKATGDSAGGDAVLAAIGADARLDNEMAWLGEFLLAVTGR